VQTWLVIVVVSLPSANSKIAIEALFVSLLQQCGVSAFEISVLKALCRPIFQLHTLFMLLVLLLFMLHAWVGVMRLLLVEVNVAWKQLVHHLLVLFLVHDASLGNVMG